MPAHSIHFYVWSVRNYTKEGIYNLLGISLQEELFWRYFLYSRVHLLAPWQWTLEICTCIYMILCYCGPWEFPSGSRLYALLHCFIILYWLYYMPDKDQTRLCPCKDLTDRTSPQYLNYGTPSNIKCSCIPNHISSTTLNCKRNYKSIFFPRLEGLDFLFLTMNWLYCYEFKQRGKAIMFGCSFPEVWKRNYRILVLQRNSFGCCPCSISFCL